MTLVPGSTQSIPRTARAPAIDPAISLNFSVAKVASILMVVVGHWSVHSLLWVPVTFGLFVFAFSSAYFTARIYGVQVDRQRFWRRKLERLWLRYWVILIFLSVLLLCQGEPVFTWHSVLHFLGLTGLLNWFHIHNHSGLGEGLWFFTLLLIFYATYPYLARLTASAPVATVVTVLAFVAAVVLQERVHVGHALWLTAFGFIFGIVAGLHPLRVARGWLAGGTALCCVALVALNLFSTDRLFNSALIALGSIGVCLLLTRVTLPRWPLWAQVARLETYLLEIFLIHTYLFIHPTGHNGLDLLLSIVLIVAVAMALNVVIAGLSVRLFERRVAVP